MKKILLFAMLAVFACGCNDKKGSGDGDSDLSDSIEALVRENEQLRDEQDELLSTINEIEDGFREINEAQGNLTIARRGEGANSRERIKEDMKFIQETMAQNAELIEKLRARLRESGRQNEQLQHTIENLMAQMEAKNAEIEQLRAELERKNIHIAQLDQQVADLNEDINNLQQQSQQQGQTISQQDHQLNRAWYCAGSKRELKDHNILKSGKVLQGSFDASYFTEVDIRQMRGLNLNTRHAEILTSHPEGSYSLERDENRLYQLRIIDQDRFWSTSKYLVIQTK